MREPTTDATGCAAETARTAKPGAAALTHVAQAQAVLTDTAALLHDLRFTREANSRRGTFNQVLTEILGAELCTRPLILKSALLSGGTLLRTLAATPVVEGRRLRFDQLRVAIDAALLRLDAHTSGGQTPHSDAVIPAKRSAERESSPTRDGPVHRPPL